MKEETGARVVPTPVSEKEIQMDLDDLNSGIFNKINPEAHQGAVSDQIAPAATNPVSASIAATDTAAVLDGLAPLIRGHVKAINALGAKLAHAKAKVEQYQVAIGQHVKAIKLASPDDWENIIRAECNLGRSRAYELLAVADGTKTSAEIASATTERSKKRRERLSVAQRTQDNAGDPEASAAEMRAKFAAIEASKTAKQREPEAAQVCTAELEVARPPSAASRLKLPAGKAQLTRPDVFGWLSEAPIEECQRVFNTVGKTRIGQMIPPAWSMSPPGRASVRLSILYTRIAALEAEVAALEAEIRERDQRQLSSAFAAGRQPVCNTPLTDPRRAGATDGSDRGFL